MNHAETDPQILSQQMVKRILAIGRLLAQAEQNEAAKERRSTSDVANSAVEADNLKRAGDSPLRPQ